MRKRAVLESILSVSAILVVGWEAGSAVPSTPIGISTSGSPTASAAPTASAPPPSPSTGTPQVTPAAPQPTTAVAGNYLGTSTSTPYGQVRVQVTIAGGHITAVTPTQLTDADGRSVQISNRAAPILRQEVLAAQSSQVQMVSGATYTSEAYLSSLQSALDQAGL